MKNKSTHVPRLGAGLILALWVSHCCPVPPMKTALKVDPTPSIPANVINEEPIDIPVYEDRLENGLKVLVLEDHTSPVATVQVWYRVGSRNERPGIRGIAHLTEHMMFKGSPNVGPEDHARIIDSVGGNENAFTSEDTTAYYDTIPSDRLELAMELEAERMSSATLDKSHFFKEREVVKEEIRMLLQNNPIGALIQKFRSVTFTEHPYNWTPGGTLEDLDKMTHGDVKDFYKTHYSPNNAVLIVIGDTTPKQVMKFAREHFGPIKPGPVPKEVTVREPAQSAYRNHKLVHPTQLPFVIGGYKVPEAANEDSKVLELVQLILGGGKSSRIHRALVRDKKLAVFAGGFNQKMKDPGLFLIAAGHLPNIPADKVEQALIEEVNRLGVEGPSPEELTKARNQLQAQRAFGLTSLMQVGYELGEAELVEGDYRDYFRAQRAFEKITAADIKRVVSTYLKKDQLTSVFLSPPPADEAVKKQKATEIEEAELDTKDWETAEKYLTLGDSTADPIPLPPNERKTLQNGMKIIVVERREQPIVYLKLLTKAGRMIENMGKAGAADLLANMLTHGTKSRSAEQIAEESEQLGGRISAASGQESTALSAQFLSRDFQKGLELYADVALNPTFPKEEMDKALRPLLGQAKMVKDSPMSLAGEYLGYSIYGYDHPRGRATSEQTLKSITQKDLADLHAASFQPQNAILILVGDVDSKDAMGTLESAFGNWKNTGAVPVFPENPKPKKGNTVHLVNKPDLTQSTIYLGHLGIDRASPDYIPITLGNYVLGAGGFSSRLMKKVRSKGGKTYGVGSIFRSGIKKGPFAAYTFTRTRETGNTLQLILDEIKRIRKDGVTDSELRSAKNNLAGSYALSLETPMGMANEIVHAEFFNQGENWVQNYRKAIIAPTLKDVNAALKKHLSLKNMSMVVVGEAEQVKKQVRKFGKLKTSDYLEPVPEEERNKE